MTSPASAADLLIGPASLDRHLAADGSLDRLLPGGGALNMAYHWSQTGLPFRFVTRVGDDHAEVFTSFFDHHGIDAVDPVREGPSCSIDITIRDDRQPWMDNFVEGVWSEFRLTSTELDALRRARRAHAVLVDVVLDEMVRLGVDGSLEGVEASGDFLSMRHVDLDRFDRTMAHLSIGFVGWPGDRDDETVRGLREVAHRRGRLVVVTFGSKGVAVFDGRDGATERWVPVEAVEVHGTTVGCGDAFIAAFCDLTWRGGTIESALDAARAAGAAATAWDLPLPDDAYA